MLEESYHLAHFLRNARFRPLRASCAENLHLRFGEVPVEWNRILLADRIKLLSLFEVGDAVVREFVYLL